MATRYDLAEPENIQIQSFEDIERVLNENNIIPTYDKHLVQINCCISMFEDIETNRTFCEKLCDYAVGERGKINEKRLLEFFQKIREEILNGIEIFKRLLSQKEDVKNVFKDLNFTKIEVRENTANLPPLISVKEVGKGVMIVAGAGAIGFNACKALLRKYRGLAFTLKMLTDFKTATVCGVIGAVMGLVLVIIYKIAEYKGNERGLKYQQVRELYDTLNDGKFLGYLRAEHQKLGRDFKIIDEDLHCDEINLGLAKNHYAKAKEDASNDLANKQGMTDEAKAEIAEMQAANSCKVYLQYELKLSKDKIKRFLNKIKCNQRRDQMEDGNDHGADDPEDKIVKSKMI